MTYRIPDLKSENEALRKENKALTEENEQLRQKVQQPPALLRLWRFFQRTKPQKALLFICYLFLVTTVMSIMFFTCNLAREENLKEKQEIRESCYIRCGGGEYLVRTSRSRGIDYCLCDTEENGLVEIPAIMH